MANEAAKTQTINIVPVQGIFQPEPTFSLISLIGPAGTPFYPIIDPNESGLNISSSTINSTTIGATTPSTGVFTNIATTTGTISSAPSSPDSIVNQAYVDAIAQGLAFKAPANYTTTGNITLSGLAVQSGGDWNVTLTAGNRILVKDQTTGADNGIYLAAAGAWTRSLDANTYDELLAAYLFILDGVTLGGSAWVDTNTPGGTLGVTPITFVRFSNTALYTAGTGLTLSSYQFSITPVGTAGTYGSASAVPVFVTNASGQVTSVTNTPIAIANTAVSGLGTMSTQNANSVAITGGSINGSTVGATTAAAVIGTIVTANTYFSGAGTNLTGTASGLSIGGNAATATTAGSATNATNLSGGATGSLPYQSTTSTTTFLAAGSNGQVLTLASGVPSWATPTTGTVTSVSGTGTVSGISLSGTVTSSGSLTLGGTLDLSSPPVIGGTTPNTITGTTITANTKFVGTNFDASGSGGGSLRTSGGTAVLQWGGGGGVNLTLDGAFNMNPANYSISIAPTGTGTLTVNPATAGTRNNMSIGATTAAAGYFTTLSLTNTLSVNGSTGTNGQVLQSNGSSAPTWVTPTSYATVTDDTTTAGTRYPLFANQTTGNLSTEYVSSTKLQFNPSTGIFTATGFSGSGASLTSLTAGNLSGTIPSAVLGNSSVYIGTTAVALNRSSGSITLAGTNIDGSAGSASTATTATNATNATNIAITDNTSSSSTYYPVLSVASSGNNPATTSSTKLSFVPNTGVLSATSFSGAGTGLTGTASGLSIGGNAATATSATSATTATSATNIAGGTNLQIPYNTGAGATSFIAAPTIASTFLQYNGTGFTWAASAGIGTVTSVGQTFTGGLISVSGSPITTTGTLALTVAGTSGGIPYFSSGTTWATSAALAANALVIGGGAGAAPATTTTGTGVVTALGVNTGTSGAFVVNGGALGTPSSGTLTNCTFPTLNQNTTGSAATVTGNATGSTFGFNSGYGSVATAYGCRAWVNFNGTGTVAIRASGNVTSITDNGTGDYTVNFTTAMPDTNYAVTSLNRSPGTTTGNATQVELYNTGSTKILTLNSIFNNNDPTQVSVAVFR